MAFKKTTIPAAFIAVAGLQSIFGCSKIDNISDNETTAITNNPAYTEGAYNKEDSTVTSTENITEKETIPIIENDASFPEGHINFQGRHIYTNNIQWLVQSGSAAEFTVTGTNVSIIISGDSSIYESSTYRPRYAVFIDGELVRDKIISAPEENLILFEENTPRTANIKIVLLSEAIYGAIGIKGINITGGSTELISPAPKKKLAIEFIGDSITCGYGVDSKDGSETFSTSTENFYKSYAYIASKELDADYSVVAYSGYGVISGYSSGEKNTDEALPQYYDIISRYNGYDVKHDFSERIMDAVVINLGTNDTCYVDKDDKSTCDEFVAGYISLLEMVRKNNPKAAIICTVGLMGGNETIYPLIQKAVQQFNDDKITCFLSQAQDIEKDGSGAAWHPSEITHEKYGHIIADEIKKVIYE